MAFYEVSSDLIQKIGNDLYRINLSTLAKQVSIMAADGTTASNVQKEIEALRTLVGNVGDAVSGTATIYVKNTIADRDALTETKNTGTICYVLDASADNTVDAGAAAYIWNGTAWEKLTEFESLDVVLDWANIQNKPEYTDADGNTIDVQDALEKAHVHDNKEQIDKIGEDANGNLTYGDKKVGVDNGGTFSIKVVGDNPDYETAINALGDTPNNSIFVAMREEPVAVTGQSVMSLRSKSFSLRSTR